jgi:hypothetical protein
MLNGVTKEKSEVRSCLAVVLAALLGPGLAAAQGNSAPRSSPPANELSPGVTAFEQVQGSSTSLGVVSSEATDLGYNLTPHFGGDIGLPVFFVRSPFSLVTNHDWRWTTLFGDPYLDLRYVTERAGLRITSVLTGTIPVESPERIFNTGRFGVDWYNHLDHSWGRFTPFLNLGAANGTVDRYVMPRPYAIGRPYRSLGFISDFEGGLQYRFWRTYKIGASAYALVPGGRQKAFSRLVAPGTSVAGDNNRNRFFYSAFETVGSSRLTRDNGYSAWLELGRAEGASLQLGYTRSMHFATDSATVTLNFNLTALVRTLTATR